MVAGEKFAPEVSEGYMYQNISDFCPCGPTLHVLCLLLPLLKPVDLLRPGDRLHGHSPPPVRKARQRLSV